MKFRYWVSDLRTDEGVFINNGVELDKFIQNMLNMGVEKDNIGIVLEVVE